MAEFRNDPTEFYDVDPKTGKVDIDLDALRESIQKPIDVSTVDADGNKVEATVLPEVGNESDLPEADRS